MSNRAWMPLHIGDYLKDTGHLTAAEHGAYLLLIMRYWQDGGLPADERLIARYARLSPSEWEESRAVIAALFSDGWQHKRIDAELAKADDIIEKRKAAAGARHGKRKDANAVQVESTSTDTGALPRTYNQDLDAADCAPMRSRAQLDRLESDLRAAAGLETNPSPALMMLAPILGLLDRGYDLESDILSVVRAVSQRMKRPAGSWDYFVKPIVEAAERRAGATSARAPPGTEPRGANVFERIQKGLANGHGGQGGGIGPVVDAVRSVPDIGGQEQRDDGKGVPPGNRRMLTSRAS